MLYLLIYPCVKCCIRQNDWKESRSSGVEKEQWNKNKNLLREDDAVDMI